MYLETFFDDRGTKIGCTQCNGRTPVDFDLKMAFQPIIDVQSRRVFAYEALVRGANGEFAFKVISKVTKNQLYQFDQTCRS